MSIEEYEVWVNLGCSKEEQSFLQPVHFDVQLFFNSIVEAQKTDQLSDSIDYVELTELIQTVAVKKSYAMIEHLCYSVFEVLKNKYKGKFQAELVVKAKKLRPPVKNLQGGVSWTCQSHLSS